jgi:DNA-binding NarL/FixJ family response regulator
MKILVIDNYPISRKGMSMILQAQFPEATINELDGFTVAHHTRADFKPDLIVFAIGQLIQSQDRMPINRIRKNYPTSKVIVYDDNADYDMLVSSFRSGVDGYLSKKSDVNELLECIKKVLSGKKYATNEALVELMFNRYPSATDGPNIMRPTLTAHEWEIASYLTEGMKTTLIAQTLKRKVSTISTIKSTIFKKLKVDNVFALREAMRSEQPYYNPPQAL